ncbi:putative DsbA family dithiol-disulfide isomerase [Hymenobacter luteus]|uniref:DsbA family dithiol-disulfide isomerase n=2 Tax=Hymenobacter TaxID=89966 RepID=A0ABR6JSI5_9BACT|nr:MULTISPECIES: DsbA family oxidoreductase [Hymenobacter]MBB4599793.1 putative DsbA family dithiol-disulfide isomerase [Hymenobacter latericoloratus]MBB6057897.1 putative DsbA family dithiol-disulfide isomerase [Hymenobacter luteus]
MKIEIWSDIVCPFCYIGKRRLEKALANFAHADAVEIEWRSFELDPETQPKPGVSLYQLLAAKYGNTEAWARQMSANMTQMAAAEGLAFDFDRAVHANTLHAHRLVHLAARHGKQDAAKERFFQAYLEEGQDLNDAATLARLATELGLPAAEVEQVLQSDEFAQEVRHDEYQARQIGVRGVPYFVFDDKYAVSGAQPTELFQEVLEKVWAESRPRPVQLAGADGAACGLDGSNC